jgi:hypothetical protein
MKYVAVKLSGRTLQAHRALGVEGKDENQNQTGKVMWWPRVRQRRALHVSGHWLLDSTQKEGARMKEEEEGKSSCAYGDSTSRWSERHVLCLMQGTRVWEEVSDNMDWKLIFSGYCQYLPGSRWRSLDVER